MMTLAKIAAKQWLAAIAMANALLRASAQSSQTPLLVGDDGALVNSKCTPLVVDGGTTVGEVCASLTGSNMEVEITATVEQCVLRETHVCNMPVEMWESVDETKTYKYAIDTEQVYMFTCGLGDEEGIYVIAGHAQLACGFAQDLLMAYYEMGIACPPDTTTAAPVTTVATRATTTTTTTTIATTTPTGPDENIIGTPECPYTQCVEGETYVTESCECTEPNSPCDACPIGTRCQEADENEGIPFMCIDCECGFCASDGGSCCSVNARGNNCKDESNDRVCNLQNDYWPAHIGSGNTCGGVEVTKGDPKNGCGCKPSHLTPCTYDQRDRTNADMCYVCSVEEIFDEPLCLECRQCLIDQCGHDTCVENAMNAAEMTECLSSKHPLMDACREACATAEDAPCIKV